MPTLPMAAQSANPSAGRAQLANAFWAALAQVANLECNRDGLPDCSSFTVDLCVTGTINGEPIEQLIAGTLDVGKLDRKPGRAARPASRVEDANELLANLRRLQRSPVRDPVRFKYATIPALSSLSHVG